MVATNRGRQNCVAVVGYDSVYTETYISFMPKVSSLYQKPILVPSDFCQDFQDHYSRIKTGLAKTKKSIYF